MKEALVVLGEGGTPLYWHLPEERSMTHLPDSRTLWGVLWNQRHLVVGVAHSHPGTGRPSPSWEDCTTFSAIEQGLGRRLSWWITSDDGLVVVRWVGPDKYDYETEESSERPDWLMSLRMRSREDRG